MVKMKLILVLIAGLLSAFIMPIISYAQFLPIVQEKDTRQNYEALATMFDQRKYQEVLPAYKQLLLEDPENSNLNFIVADCFMNIDGLENDALPLLEKAIKNTIPNYTNTPSQRKAPVFAYVRIGDYLYNDYKFDEALINYKVFRTYLDPKKDKVQLDDINRKIDITANAKKLMENTAKVTLSELPYVNAASFSDYAAQVADNGSVIYFSRRKMGVTGQGGSDIFYMKKTDNKWGRPIRMPFINSDADDNFCSVSKDGNTMFFSSNRDGNFHIFSSTRKGKSLWSEPVPLNPNINTPKSEESFACISSDGKTLYFVSDRKGGRGGKDIYRSTRPFGGDWGVSENLGNTINTPGNEESPFISDDSKTLYFSSNGLAGMGGYDIFYTNVNGISFSSPVNAGFPINTLSDDLFYIKSNSNPKDYFVSRSKSGKNEFSVTLVSESTSTTSVAEVKAKEQTKEKQKLKLVPKTLKY